MAEQGGWKAMYYEQRATCARVVHERNALEGRLREADSERGRLSIANARLASENMRLKARNAELERCLDG